MHNCTITDYQAFDKLHLNALVLNISAEESRFLKTNFPSHVSYLRIDTENLKGENLKLMDYHQLIHEEHRLDNLRLVTGSMPRIKLSETIVSMEDPFEFQEWCIENNLEDYL